MSLAITRTPNSFAEVGARLNAIQDVLKRQSGPQRVPHNHDPLYYRETEVDELLAQVIPSGVLAPCAMDASSVPSGWLLCDGDDVSRETYSDLFDAIGTTYGAGDGSTTFTLPDLRGRVPLGKAESGTGDTLGETGGALDHVHTGPSHTHTTPDHTHSVSVSGSAASAGAHSHGGSTGLTGGTRSDPDSSGSLVGNTGSHQHSIGSDGSHSHSVSAGGTAASSGAGTTGSSGTGNTGSANPPFQTFNYIIKT